MDSILLSDDGSPRLRGNDLRQRQNPIRFRDLSASAMAWRGLTHSQLGSLSIRGSLLILMTKNQDAAYNAAHDKVWELIDDLVEEFGVTTAFAAQVVKENAQSSYEATR
tara:strand:+ start:7439 stop:7765 length:327 start_codon:yes stop_codon:yes gene_type:complete